MKANIENENCKTTTLKTRNQIAYWLGLHQIPGVGPITFQKLLQLSPDLSHLVEHTEDFALSEKFKTQLKKINWHLVEQSLQWSEKKDHHILRLNESAYPQFLKQINSPPIILFIRGNIKALMAPSLAIVGSRNPSLKGLENAVSFAKQLSERGIVIVSGLALGIDTAAHRGTLMVKGNTHAVLGCGLNQIYPRTNTSLADEIIANGGALLSEFSLNASPKPQNFPQRNRIISGLCSGVLVIEASMRSGSLITARLAAEQGREVFAVPGSIHNHLAQGCHHLIRQGAKLVETIDDILEEIPFFPKNTRLRVLHSKPSPSSAIDSPLLKLIGHETTSIEQLLHHTHFGVERLTQELSELEITGAIVAVPGGYVLQT